MLNNKCLRHSMNRIQSVDHKIGTYEINKISSSCFHDQIYIKNNGYNGLGLVIRVNYKKSVIYLKNLSGQSIKIYPPIN